MDEHEKELLRERDDVLTDFLEVCPKPTKRQIEEWRARHPRHAGAILDMGVALFRFGVADPSEPTLEEEEETWRRHLALSGRLERGETVARAKAATGIATHESARDTETPF